jgi:hypothetical protein
MIRSIYILIAFLTVLSIQITYGSNGEFKKVNIEGDITSVQPMTGIVFWNGKNASTDAISLEFSYMLFSDIVKNKGEYNWDALDEKLTEISSRKHQAILRFRYSYVGKQTSVPDYIKERDDYNEIKGISEGRETWFPDWTNEELKRFTLEFYQKFSEKYDKDPRIAFLQVGFGLWGEYHIYDGPFELGVTFPSKKFQELFFYHLDSVFTETPWSISIDAADDNYSPFSVDEELMKLDFGNFDDSFMHENHSGYNASCWSFFDNGRYRYSPAGGEFSYYTSFDQKHVLDLPNGAHGKSYEEMARKFKISYIIGNDQPKYQTIDRIKEAGMATGYKFKIIDAQTDGVKTYITIKNIGTAPIYYDAYPAINSIRSDASLTGLVSGEQRQFVLNEPWSDEKSSFEIQCDRLVAGQMIEFYGTQSSNSKFSSDELKGKPQTIIYPTTIKNGENVTIITDHENNITAKIFNLNGVLLDEIRILKSFEYNTTSLSKGHYFVSLEAEKGVFASQRFIIY